ncbi:MAG: nucleotide sugar dehydrogenase [Bacteroidota bacterium]
MRISVFGLGYVGSVSAAGLADLGHQVIGVDLVEEKVEALRAGGAPVKEPGLDELLRKHLDGEQLTFTTHSRQAVLNTDCAMIAVGTPSTADGQVNLTSVERCVRGIAETLAESDKDEYTVVIRSTVPPATTDRMASIARDTLAAKGKECRLFFSMNPEFTREGAAVKDFFYPALIVFGQDDPEAQARLEPIYQGIEAETLWVATRTAELVKYTNNAFHALKVAFANEIGRVAEAYGINSQEVMGILCADTKLNISTKYLRPGFAFGGSCLPKDLRGIDGIAKQEAVDIPLLRSILPSNDVHIEHFKTSILNKMPAKVGLLGLAFKNDTDDLRESPALKLAASLIAAGVELKMHDVNLELRYLMGRNKSYIDELLPTWQSHYLDNAQEVFAFADTIVVSNTQGIYRDWVSEYAGDKEVIFLN